MPNWDKRYAGGKYSSDKPHKLLIELANSLTSAEALDLACGIGRHANFLAEKCWHVTAVDNSSVGIGIAKQRAEEKGVKVDYRVADLEKDEFKIELDTYDLICDFYYLQHDLFLPMKTGVKPGGIIVSTIHIYGEGESSEGFLLKEGELLEFFNDFEILHYNETCPFDKDPGHHHHRTAELIARRRS